MSSPEFFVKSYTSSKLAHSVSHLSCASDAADADVPTTISCNVQCLDLSLYLHVWTLHLISWSPIYLFSFLRKIFPSASGGKNFSIFCKAKINYLLSFSFRKQKIFRFLQSKNKTAYHYTPPKQKILCIKSIIRKYDYDIFPTRKRSPPWYLSSTPIAIR